MLWIRNITQTAMSAVIKTEKKKTMSLLLSSTPSIVFLLAYSLTVS